MGSVRLLPKYAGPWTQELEVPGLLAVETSALQWRQRRLWIEVKFRSTAAGGVVVCVVEVRRGARVPNFHRLQ